MQGAVFSTPTADSYPVAAASGHSARADIEARFRAEAAPPPAAASQQAASSPISDSSRQTLREALAHAAEGRILAARALLETAAAASDLSEAAFLAKLQALVPPEAAPDAANGHAISAAADGVTSASLSPFQAVAAARAAEATSAQQAAAVNGRHGAEEHSGQLTRGEVARVLALPAEADLIQDSLRQFHDRDGYTFARNDDLKVSYRHIKGAAVFGANNAA